MRSNNRFRICNNSAKPLELYIEPEGACYLLEKGQEVSVLDVFTTAPVTVMIATNDSGDPYISIWPGDGEVKVEKDGVDVLDIP